VEKRPFFFLFLPVFEIKGNGFVEFKVEMGEAFGWKVSEWVIRNWIGGLLGKNKVSER